VVHTLVRVATVIRQSVAALENTLLYCRKLMQCILTRFNVNRTDILFTQRIIFTLIWALNRSDCHDLISRSLFLTVMCVLLGHAVA
jgi:hypothetical protein